MTRPPPDQTRDTSRRAGTPSGVPALRLVGTERGVPSTPLPGRHGVSRPSGVPQRMLPAPSSGEERRASRVSQARAQSRTPADGRRPSPPTPAQEIAEANRAAATISRSDARWVFAARVASSLEGGRAAVLPPERRARLVTQARSLGLREFDANLIVAIVQDSARTGGAPLGPETADRLPLVASAAPETGGDDRGAAMLLLSAVCLAAAIAVIGARWLLMA